MSVYVEQKGYYGSAAGLGRVAELVRLEIGQRRYHLHQLREVFETRLQNVDKPIAKLRQLLTNLLAVVRQAAV